MTPAERAAWQDVEDAERTAEEALRALEAALERLTSVTRREVRRERKRNLRVVRASVAP